MLPGLYLCVSTKFQLDLNGINRKRCSRIKNHQFSDKTRLENNSTVHSLAELKYSGVIILLVDLDGTSDARDCHMTIDYDVNKA